MIATLDIKRMLSSRVDAEKQSCSCLIMCDFVRVTNYVTGILARR